MKEVCHPGDIILVPFPFTNLKSKKKRPGLVISPPAFNEYGDTTILFITSNLQTPAKPGDLRLKNWKSYGLPRESLLRMKFVTLANDLIIKKIGSIPVTDYNNISKSIFRFLTP